VTVTVEIDEQIFGLQFRGGISRYFVELIREFQTRTALGINISTPYRYVKNRHLVEFSPGAHRRTDARRPVRRLLNLGTRLGTPAPDVLHYTYYLPSALRRPSMATVSTIHDMIPELFPEEFPLGNPHAAKREFVRASRGVVCISETTRRDMLAYYRGVTADVVVIPHGVGDEFRHPATPAIKMPSRYLLFVGQREGYKDWRTLVEALTSVRGLDDVHLVCVGGGAFSDEELALLRARRIFSRTAQISISDSDLPGAYAMAEALIFPSRYEGFGLPILEAFAAGCPVIAADTDCFREVADTAAMFFPPGDASELASRLVTLRNSAQLRSRHVASGRIRAADFTWARTAEMTANFYHQICHPSTSGH
jgi:glycosyltransferase involved in cell wall biosynthesis